MHLESAHARCDAATLEAGGLPDPASEHDSCGVGFIARLDAKPKHSVVEDAVRILINLEHRGALGGDKATGDGAGLLVDLPDAFFQEVATDYGIRLPQRGDYAVGMVFLPTDAEVARECVRIFERVAESESCPVIGWRDVPVDDSPLGAFARGAQPRIRQVFLARGVAVPGDAFERKLYVIRRVVEKEIARVCADAAGAFYVASLSARTIVYKGMLVGSQLAGFYPDLRDERFACAFALVHQRYSTNTFPSWSLAQPFRILGHNGEINALRGNVSRMRAREALLESDRFGHDVEKLKPIIVEGGSDSAMFDNALELLVMGGRSLPHAVMMMAPEAWGAKFVMGEDRRAFYEYHAAMMEPWDGPAALVFTDGRYIGATLDRNGLRPARYTLTRDGRVILASETGVLDVPGRDILERGRLQPGKMLLADLNQHRVIPDQEIKAAISLQRPYRRWLRENRIELRGLLMPSDIQVADPDVLRVQQHAFGYTDEELKRVIAPMAARGQEAVGSMGNDAALAVLSLRPQLLFAYFKQFFAQVTNPAIDPLREELIMSLMGFAGRGRNLLDETPEHARQLKLNHPILTPEDMHRLRSASHPDVVVREIDALFPVAGGAKALEGALDAVFEQAEAHLAEGATILVLTDRKVDADHAPIPSLLAASGLHHHLIRQGLRNAAGIVVETGEAREVIHFALLIAYGANAVCPYVAFSTVRDMARAGELADEKSVSADEATDSYITAVKKGLLKTFSRMGISTIRSFFGSQIFEAVGLGRGLVERYFTGTASRVGGLGMEEIATETLARHARAYPPSGARPRLLDTGGAYHNRMGAEQHLWTPDAVHELQQATRASDEAAFKKFARLMDEQPGGRVTLRSLLRLRKGDAVPIDEVEPVESILTRFAGAAMSFGSISKEAHETIAIAMNRIGARSNSGEGGEDPDRYVTLPNGDSKCSRTKQIASGRFGVTIEYLNHADELQIKVAQGAKPGEGGQLPAHKVSVEIARVRHTTPGVTLISPPPHHDIYSIEDLAQLIYDLKCANPKARVSVKLVSGAGVGTIAAGVAKAGADMVLVAGHDGGTGASPLTAIKHTGLPWELGLADTQQALCGNHLRDRIRVQVDGQLRTGRDLAIAACLGAEEFGFGSVLLVTLGCVMMRKCHLNTCPVGVATQDPELRKRFTGKPEYVERFLRFIAQDLRERMAEMGFRTVDEMVGRADMIEVADAADHPKARRLDFSALLVPGTNGTLRSTRGQDDRLGGAFDREVIEQARPALERGEPVEIDMPIRNVHRAAGAMLSGEIAKRHGLAGLPDDTIRLLLAGSAGQSLGAFLAKGVTIRVQGDANDYLGKGLSGGRIILVPPTDAAFEAHENIIVGNVALYGATGGEVFARGVAGERFAVRNSGACAVVEGVGDHGCEYMTGGVVVVLGPTGYNFAAGMSGGIAYVYNESDLFDTRCQLDMVDLESVTDDEDTSRLRALIERHAELTGSTRAAHILGRWETCLPLFVKVMPIDYCRSLERMRLREDVTKETVSATEEVAAHDPRGFMLYERENAPKRPVARRVLDYAEVEERLPAPRLAVQAARCMDCGIPYCHTFGCPLRNLVPDWNDLVCRGQWRKALDLLHATNTLPEITGRVCPAPCEAACTLSINQPAVTIKQIELEIVERGWEKGWIHPEPAPEKTGRRVAVVGSGPTGLAAAQDLARRGHEVIVFERADRVGGILRYGIPEFKLEKWVIDRRLEQMRAEGVTFETGVDVGLGVSARYIRRTFDAVLLGTGARVPRDLDAPGRDLAGIHFAMPYLTQQNRRLAGDCLADADCVTAKDKTVVVIGGGDTGSDCVGTARRQGARHITQIELLPEPPTERSADNPWPTWPNVLRTSSSHEEGCDRLWSVLTKAFVGDHGAVQKLECVRLEWSEPDANGRRTFKEIPGSAFQIDADLVVLAMGFLRVEHGALVKDFKVATCERGNICVDETLMTSAPGVFAGGDAVLGASLVVRAIALGQRAAQAIDNYLKR